MYILGKFCSVIRLLKMLCESLLELMVGKMFSPLTVYKIVHNLFPMLKINTTTNVCKLCLMALTKQPLNIRTLEIFKTN